MEKGGVWPGAALLALEEEEEAESEEKGEEEEEDSSSGLLWDALYDGPASLCPNLWTQQSINEETHHTVHLKRV